MKNLYDIFAEQIEYNEEIRNKGFENKDHWTEKYLLGMIAEVDEVLREINWKRHRKSDIPRRFDKVSMAMELADLTKYAFSLWELWGFTAEDLLFYVGQKNDILKLRYDQEFAEIPKDRSVVITDLDGTVGNWRWAFMNFIMNKGVTALTEIPETSLAMDTDLSMRFPDYYELKDEFERSGGYRNIPVYPDAALLLESLKDLDAYIIAVTARPADKYKRIWLDTWEWIEDNKLCIDKLIITAEPRLLLADKLRKGSNQKIILLEDDPGLILRGANSGFRVFVRRHNYNQNIVNGNVKIVNKFTDIDLEKYLE
jgi:NTP pyrophosphatase (non-canonical NTP hydrolase)